jgi:hypothetical protein
MPPESKQKTVTVATSVPLENQFGGTEKWPLKASKEPARFAADSNSFTLQLVNLQNALSRANRTEN